MKHKHLLHGNLLTWYILCFFIFSQNNQAQNYDISIKGRLITAENKNDVLGDGKISYDPDHHVLTLNNAIIDTANHIHCIRIWNTLSSYTIKLVGNNKLSSEEVPAIFSSAYSPVHIIGPGRLNISSSKSSAISIVKELRITDNAIISAYATDVCGINTGDDLTVSKGAKVITHSINENGITTLKGLIVKENGHVDASGKKYGIQAASINLNHCTLHTVADESTGEGLTCERITLTNCHISKPIYTTLSQNKITENGQKVQEIEVAYNYNIYVGNTQVTDINKHDILGNGTVSYDTETLTLNQATITSGENYKNNHHGIYFGTGIKNPTLRLNGSNTITCTAPYSPACAVYCVADTLTITGSETDRLDATSTFGSSIAANTITINGGCTVQATGNYFAIYNQYYSNKLTINNSNLMAKSVSGTDGCIMYRNISLIDCHISTPQTATLIPDVGFRDKGDVVPEIFIKSGNETGNDLICERKEKVWSADGILFIETEKTNEIQIFNLSGQLIRTLEGISGIRTVTGLDNGIYFVRSDGHTYKVILH